MPAILQTFFSFSRVFATEDIVVPMSIEVGHTVWKCQKFTLTIKSTKNYVDFIPQTSLFDIVEYSRNDLLFL